MDYEQLKGNLEDVLNDLRHLALSHESIQFDESLPCTAGGYGDVFKATLRASNNEPDRLVAVKELRRAGDPISRTRLAIHLARELRVWARLKHRNILELIGYHLNAQMTTALIVSPFMVNGNIIEYLEKAGHRTSDHERLKLLIDVLNGLDYLHSSTLPICHADIKPENVLITDQIVAVLCDFGLARLDDGTSSGLTTTKTIKGSVRYMSPELLDEGAYHTLQSDMWAYGCLVLRVMTGVMPYSAARSDPQVMMALTQNKPPTALNRLNLPDPGLEPLLKGCWELSPTARPSASAFLRSLIENTALSQRPPASGAHSSVYRELDLDISPDFSWAWEYEVDSQRNTDLAAVGDTREGITEYESAEQPTSLIIPTVDTYHGERLASLPRKLAELIPRLKALKPTQELLEHGGIVRDLQFSPDGRWLATCSSYRKAMIWKVEATLLRHRVLTDPVTTFLSQVAWSPNGKYLLIRASRNVKVWVAKSGVLKQTISCEDKIEAVTWLPSGDLFACLEGSVVHIMDIQGKIKADHPFGNLDIHDVAVTPDQQKMILVATLPSSQDNLEPSKSNTENKIIVYDYESRKVECQVPVPGNARNVIISSDRYYGDGYLALISYKGAAPPELWHISAVAENPRLERLQTYTSTATADFAGPSHFGGQQDQFVICAGQKGTIYVWDRETGLLLHSLQGPQNAYNVVEKMTSVAWNSCATGRYMLASGTNHGTVQIWTTPEEELE